MLACVCVCARIHQVRSVGNNVAVNVWWRYLNSDISVDDCPLHDIDESLTLDQLSRHGDSDSCQSQSHSLRWVCTLLIALLLASAT